MAVEVIIKKWGNSRGALFPKDFLEKRGIKENEKVLVEVFRKSDLSDIFGSLKGMKMTGQQFKDLVRKGSM
ncbi:MAG TPA: AbrB/MazE/SpoVT family DNA-binding domain-containing protein [archaeon]|nr:AbrB/MazE/SpoVT family DNA-binding domain-containing protein [archaeon]